MKYLTIYIDPTILSQYKPEVYWVFRYLFLCTGYVWREEPDQTKSYDIAYIIDTHDTAIKYKSSTMIIYANISNWENRLRLKLADIYHHDTCYYPSYLNDHEILFLESDGKLYLKRDIIFDIFWLLTGQEERQWSQDQHGNIILKANVKVLTNSFKYALCSSITNLILKLLRAKGYCFNLEPWPNHKRAAVCIGHDIDYPEIIWWIEPFRLLLRNGLKSLHHAFKIIRKKASNWHFNSLILLEKKYNLTSSFYFASKKGSLLKFLAGTPDPFYDISSPQFQTMFSILINEGFEIGLHASYNAFQNEQQFRAEKLILEQICRHFVVGNRHHFWHLNPTDRESTLLIHEQIGFLYDSSIGHDRYIGWRHGSCLPYFPYNQKKRRELKTLQIPTGWMDDHLFGRKAFNPGTPTEILSDLLQVIFNYGGCLNICFHNYLYDSQQYPGRLALFIWFLETIKSRSDLWIAQPKDVAQHWINRYQNILSKSIGLQE